MTGHGATPEPAPETEKLARFDLAPAGVVRAAAWPIESLAPFGLAPLERRAERSFEQGYEDLLARERTALWELTAGDTRFLKATAVASESLLTRVLKHEGPTTPRDKRTRHLETSLYRYLSRASTCTTPHGLWAGVCLASFGECEALAPAPSRVDFTPDLVPFAAAVEGLAVRPEYRTVAHFRLTPTLRRRGDGAWTFLARTRRGDIEVRELRSDGALALLLERVRAAGTGTLDDLAERAQAPRQLLDSLAEAGVLPGGLAFPARFATTWEALAVAGDALLDADRVVWTRVVSAIAQIAERLNEHFDALSPQALAVELAKAREPVDGLFSALGVAGGPCRAALRCDMTAPFSLALGPETRSALVAGVAMRAHDLLRPTRERRVAIAEHVACRPLALGEELGALTRNPLGERRHEDNPWGCLVARLGDGRVSVVGIDESPVRPFARFTAILGSGHAVERWVEQLFTRLETQHGVVACDLVLPFEANPNVLARASLARPAYAPWGASGPDLEGACLCQESGALILRVPAIGRVVLYAATTPATVPCDPMAGPLAVVGFADAAEGVASDAAQGGGGWVRRERTALTPKEIGSLVRLSRIDRFAHWLDLAAAHEWSGVVAIGIDGRRPLVVSTSSPLAIEAAFEGARDARAVVIEHVDVSARVRGTGGHHVADVTIPFERAPHAFSALSPEVG